MYKNSSSQSILSRVFCLGIFFLDIDKSSVKGAFSNLIVLPTVYFNGLIRSGNDISSGIDHLPEISILTAWLLHEKLKRMTTIQKN